MQLFWSSSYAVAAANWQAVANFGIGEVDQWLTRGDVDAQLLERAAARGDSPGIDDEEPFDEPPDAEGYRLLHDMVVQASCIMDGTTRLADLGLDVEDSQTILFAQPDTLEDGANYAIELIETGYIRMVIFDSVAAMMPSAKAAPIDDFWIASARRFTETPTVGCSGG